MMPYPEYEVIIPARLASSRLPGKVLRDIVGKPMLIHVVEAARKSHARKIWVATDSKTIAIICKQFDVPYIMTSPTHQSGTDRLAQAAKILNLPDETIVINLQGDEPAINPTLLDDLASALANTTAAAVTVAHPITQQEDLHNPNVVKTVLNAKNEALYFSRSLIPYMRTKGIQLPVLRHIGMYAYRAHLLKRYTQLQVSPLEQSEMLEQLRLLWHGITIHVLISTNSPSIGVDTEEDLQCIIEFFKSKESA